MQILVDFIDSDQNDIYKQYIVLMQVIIAALYYNPALLLATLDKIQIPGMAGGVFGNFVQQWIHDTDCFIGLHDRKLCVLGLVHLLQVLHLLLGQSLHVYCVCESVCRCLTTLRWWLTPPSFCPQPSSCSMG